MTLVLAWLLRIRFDTRQFTGFSLLGGIVCIVAIFRPPVISLLPALVDGWLTFLLPLAIGMSVPRRWLAPTFVLIAAWLAFLGGFWLFLDLRGEGKSPLYWIAFFAASLIMLFCARLTAIETNQRDPESRCISCLRSPAVDAPSPNSSDAA